jgi:energy-coupling factor transporter ATP-binding protein EcfA2
MISFPVLKSLTIEKYGLIPSSKRNPFVIEFQPGQNAIVGVNGSGKSTLVNIALRCLTGPYNLPAATSGTEFGQVRARLVAMPKSERTMFARRVAGGGAGAVATIVVSFGQKTLEIKRQLTDLSLVSCLISDRLTDTTAIDKQQFADEPTYQTEISNCVGVAQFFDALIIIHFLVFMMEDRRTLVWDPSAQRQIFRVLLLPADRATEYASAQQDVVSRDSAVRNTQSVMNRHKGQIKAARSHAKNIKDAEAERRVLSKQASVLREKIDQLAQARLQADKERQAGRLDRLKAAEARESIIRELERIKLDALGSLLGPSQQTLRYIVGQMLSEHRCLVCGTDPSPTAEKVDQWVKSGHCPICGSKHTPADKVVPLTEAHRKRIERLEDELEYADEQIANADQRISEAVAAFNKMDAEFDKLERQRVTLDLKIVEILRKIPTERAAIASSQNDLEALTNALARDKRALKKAEARFKKVVAETVKRVESLQDQIAHSFQKYLKLFIKESAELVYHTVQDRVGQFGASFEFPAFNLSMTGGAVAGPTTRDNPTEVSQSQAEFVDLAFRMALMTIAAGGGPSTLIVDAPEASLDFLFAERAGHQLAVFSKAHKENRVLVTSYLPSVHLLVAFLEGISGEARRRERIVDLIQNAAANAAMRADKSQYEQFLSSIVRHRG